MLPLTLNTLCSRDDYLLVIYLSSIREKGRGPEAFKYYSDLAQVNTHLENLSCPYPILAEWGFSSISHQWASALSNLSPPANLITFFIITLHHHQHGEFCIRGQGLNNFLRASILRRTSARSISQAITFVIHTICMMELWTCYHVHICCLGVASIEF